MESAAAAAATAMNSENLESRSLKGFPGHIGKSFLLATKTMTTYLRLVHRAAVRICM